VRPLEFAGLVNASLRRSEALLARVAQTSPETASRRTSRSSWSRSHDYSGARECNSSTSPHLRCQARFRVSTQLNSGKSPRRRYHPPLTNSNHALSRSTIAKLASIDAGHSFAMVHFRCLGTRATRTYWVVAWLRAHLTRIFGILRDVRRRRGGSL
jgi:hypothetical protein